MVLHSVLEVKTSADCKHALRTNEGYPTIIWP
jgi:hypothetical protein